MHNRCESSVSRIMREEARLGRLEGEEGGKEVEIPDLDNLCQKSYCKTPLRNDTLFGGGCEIGKCKIFF